MNSNRSENGFFLRSNNKAKAILPLLIGGTILFLLLYKIGLGDIKENLTKARLSYVLLAAVFLCLVLAVKVARWKLLLNRLGIRNSAKIYFIGQAVNEIAPPGSGEITRILIAKKKHNVPRSRTLVATVVARFFDVLYLLIFASLGLYFIVENEIGTVRLIFPVIIIVTAGFVLFKPTIIGNFRAFLEKFNNKPCRKGSELLKSLENALIIFHRENVRNQVIGVGLTAVAWLLDGVCHLYLIKAFGYDISLLKIYAIIATAWLLGTFSFLPGGLGVREGIYVFLLEAQSIPESIGISIILVQRLLLYSYFSTGALLSLVSYR